MAQLANAFVSICNAIAYAHSRGATELLGKVLSRQGGHPEACYFLSEMAQLANDLSQTDKYLFDAVSRGAADSPYWLFCLDQLVTIRTPSGTPIADEVRQQQRRAAMRER